MAELSDVGQRARRRIAYRLLPFVFLIYVVNYIDRVNVSFANLRMSADLRFSDRIYGLGVGMFYLTYVLFEIPGAVIAERWSARKWIARIMISWGIVTALTGFVHTAGQFYAARFLLGVAESSFFPAMIVYLTHWFRMRERGRAIACLYAAVPAASLIGSPLAGWLLGVHWQSLAGWRWLFILEGIPAIVLGIITIFYLTDWPAQARWLPEQERTWLVSELQAELEAKKKKRNFTMMQVFAERRILILVFAYLLAMTGYLGNAYWMPTFVKRVSGFSNKNVTSLLMIPALILQRLIQIFLGIFISPDAEIGPGLVIHTPYAVNVAPVKIGANCTIQSGVLIGSGVRSVGDNVYFGAGCKIVGDGKIGNNVVIVANSVVLTDVPDNTTIMGVPARIKLRGGRPRRFPWRPGNSADKTAPESNSALKDQNPKARS